MLLLKCSMIYTVVSFPLLHIKHKRARERYAPLGKCNYVTNQLVIISLEWQDWAFWPGMARAQKMLGGEAVDTDAGRGANPA